MSCCAGTLPNLVPQGRRAARSTHGNLQALNQMTQDGEPGLRGADGLHHPQAHRPLGHVSLSTCSFLLSSTEKKNVSVYWYLPTLFSETYFILHLQPNILSLQMRKKILVIKGKESFSR